MMMTSPSNKHCNLCTRNPIHLVCNKTNQAKKTSNIATKLSDTLFARTVIDDQVERPPTFTSLPRGANKSEQIIKLHFKTAFISVCVIQ